MEAQVEISHRSGRGGQENDGSDLKELTNHVPVYDGVSLIALRN